MNWHLSEILMMRSWVQVYVFEIWLKKSLCCKAFLVPCTPGMLPLDRPKCHYPIRTVTVLLDCLPWRGKGSSPLSLTAYASKHPEASQKTPLTSATLFHSLSPAINFQNFNNKNKSFWEFLILCVQILELTSLSHLSSKIAFKVKHCHSEESA